MGNSTACICCDDAHGTLVDERGKWTGGSAYPLGPNGHEEWESLKRAFTGGDMVLIKGSWLDQLGREGKAVLPRCQDLPRGAFWDVKELARDVEDHTRPTPQFLMISHPWLSREHPDPDGYHLSIFAPLLKHHAWHHKVGLESLAVFIDWCSMPQAPRSDQEEIAYKRASSRIGLCFAHWMTEVWLLTQVPQGTTPFEDRGWTSFEGAVSSFISPPNSLLDLGRLHPGWKSWGQVLQDCEATRCPPMAPGAFGVELLAKAFTCSSDRELLSMQYAALFHQVMDNTESLWFAGHGWGDREALELAVVLPHCPRLRELELHGNEIADAGARALKNVLSLCDNLVKLDVEDNHLSKSAVVELVEQWALLAKPRHGLICQNQHVPLRSATSAMVRYGRGATRSGASSPSNASVRSGLASQTTLALIPEARSTQDGTNFTALLARQAAFEARVDTAMSRLESHLGKVVDSAKGR